MELIKSNQSLKIFKILLLVILGSVALTISAKIKIPFYPVPMTMQTFVVLFMGVAFGWKISVATISLYLDKKFKEDSIGKLYYDYKDSLKTKRSFKSYEVASIANSSRFPDLFGYFIKVKNQLKRQALDLMDTNCSHYLVSNGKIKFHVKPDKNEESIDIKEGDAIWISAYTKHGFTGNGSLIKISDGQNINYLEKIDLINTYNLKNTLARGRNDKVTWGYDA